MRTQNFWYWCPKVSACREFWSKNLRLCLTFLNSPMSFLDGCKQIGYFVISPSISFKDIWTKTFNHLKYRLSHGIGSFSICILANYRRKNFKRHLHFQALHSSSLLGKLSFASYAPYFLAFWYETRFHDCCGHFRSLLLKWWLWVMCFKFHS